MSAAARSVMVFGGYLAAVGGSLVLAPATILPLVGFPPAADGWVRVAGVLVLGIAYADLRLGRAEVVAWFHASVHVRVAVAALFGAFALLGLAPGMLALFGAIDLAGALWTAAALRADASVALAAPSSVRENLRISDRSRAR